ncbi:hypothetical protein SAMN04487969_1024 [Paenibacillus algorifonticola]|uniref:Uncharacterized protein n=1 Tax=Paenibacillus algorifonticola TaxID=684063 RepID=A0A1I1ZPF1_9BACL|nr:hypothetical protein SAMN04487969_1024 [Paenibacillus algorifonticola]
MTVMSTPNFVYKWIFGNPITKICYRNERSQLGETPTIFIKNGTFVFEPVVPIHYVRAGEPGSPPWAHCAAFSVQIGLNH